MSMLPPARPDHNSNPPSPAPTPGTSRRRPAPAPGSAPRTLNFIGPQPRLADARPTPGNATHGNARAGGGDLARNPASRGRPTAHAQVQPRLRLVGVDAIVKPHFAPPPGTLPGTPPGNSPESFSGVPIAGTADPRWVLAVRVAEQLQGSALPPAKRDRLVRLGKMFGLTAFDANLIIAIVQDQARRGYAPAYCPTAGEPQLRMVPPPAPQRWMTGQRTLLIAGLIAGFIALELIALSWVF